MKQTENIEIEDFNDIENSFNFDAEFFEKESEFVGFDTRIIKPIKSKDKISCWNNAVKMAEKIIVCKGMNYFSIIDGSFIFGDLIEAILVKKQMRAFRLDIQTLSMSRENTDSLATLLIKGYVKELNLTVSDYFFSHERHRLIPYIYENLDIENRFQLIVAGTHTKIVALRLTNGIDMVIHGSANLRSSGNIEQISINDNTEICDFVFGITDQLSTKYKTINKNLRGKELWKKIEATTAGVRLEQEPQQEEAVHPTFQTYHSDKP